MLNHLSKLAQIKLRETKSAILIIHGTLSPKGTQFAIEVLLLAHNQIEPTALREYFINFILSKFWGFHAISIHNS